MATIYLLRHGQTTWNKDQRFRGRKDVFLSNQGKKEAEAVADALEGDGIEHIYASPLSRSMMTLAPLAKRLGKEVTPLEDVIDMNFGEWEGMKVEDTEKEYPDLFKLWVNEPELLTFPKGESLQQVQARAMRAVSRLAIEFADAKIAICSHRVLCKLIVLGLIGARPDKFWTIRQDTACLNRFDYTPPKAVIHSVNETFHLRELGGMLKADF